VVQGERCALLCDWKEDEEEGGGGSSAWLQFSEFLLQLRNVTAAVTGDARVSV
jgi:hypothetical protein